MQIAFECPVCEYPGRLEIPPAHTWSCPRCDHLLSPVSTDGSVAPGSSPALPACALCGNADLYRKKDFPHALGMGILVLACLASTITYWFYDWWLTWGILIGSAAFDGLLYLCVPDVVVCYRCGARHRGVAASTHAPFELTIHERYRQERLRKLEVSRMKDE